MKLTEGQIKMMQEDMYAELIQILMEKYGYTLEKAMDTLYILTPSHDCKMPILDCITKVQVMFIRF